MKSITIIKENRLRIGCSQYKLASLTGMSRYRLSLLECSYCEATAEERSRLIKALSDYGRQKQKEGKDV